MKTSYLYKLAATGIFAILLWFPALTVGQPAPIPYQSEPYFIDSGLHDGPIGPGAQPVFAFGEIIQVPDAPWLRLYFQDYSLGQETEATTSVNDTGRIK